jgi:histidinol-phosphate phosphatase family protein
MPAPGGSEVSGRPAVFLDRDGVLIRAFERDGVPRPVTAVADVELLPGVAEACAELRSAGYLLICVTNQPDVARGTLDAAVVAAINEHVQQLLALDDVLTCPHDDADGCTCRKPQPGLLLVGHGRRPVAGRRGGAAGRVSHRLRGARLRRDTAGAARPRDGRSRRRGTLDPIQGVASQSLDVAQGDGGRLWIHRWITCR